MNGDKTILGVTAFGKGYDYAEVLLEGINEALIKGEGIPLPIMEAVKKCKEMGEGADIPPRS